MYKIAAGDENELLDRWRAAIGEIGHEMVDVRARHRLFAELDDELVRRNKGQATSFAVDHFLRPIYMEAQLVALRRRTVDDDVRTTSLTVLIDEIMLRPSVVSRHSYADAVAANLPNIELTDRELDHIFGPGNDHIPSDVLAGYRSDVARDFQRVQTFVNRHVAHADRSGSEPITWAALDEALDALVGHVNRLHVPLVGGELSGDLVRRGQWRDAFRGLFPDDSPG
jgi:hypothetical protein